MSALLQDAVVTAVALGAASIILRRLVSFARPKAGESPCGSCGSGRSGCATATRPASDPQVRPLVLHRRTP